MDISKKVAYLGADLQYWGNIKGRIANTYGDDLNMEFEYTHLKLREDQLYEKYIVDILDSNIQVLYVDLARDTFPLLRFTKYLSRVEKDIVIIGLLEYLSDPVISRKAENSGVRCLIVKSGETHDAVFHPFTMAYPHEVRLPDFARAVFAEEIEMHETFIVNYMNKDFLYLEGDREFRKNDKIELETSIPEDVLLSKKYTVASVETTDHYYDFKYVYHLKYNYLDAMGPSRQDRFKRRFLDLKDVFQKDGVDLIDLDTESELEDKEDSVSVSLVLGDETETSEKINENKGKKSPLKFSDEEGEEDSFRPGPELMKLAKANLYSWILKKLNDSSDKSNRILIVDKGLTLVRDAEKPLDELPFSFRLKQVLRNADAVLNHYRPDIIALNFEEYPKDMKETEDPLNYNSVRTLKEISMFVNRTYKYDPIILVFNCHKFTTKSLRDTYEYAQMMKYEKKLTVDMISDVSKMYKESKEKNTISLLKKKKTELEKYHGKELKKIELEDLREKRLYFKGSDELSYVTYSRYIKLISLTESTVTFVADKPLKMFKTYRLKFPIPMSILLVPHEVSSPDRGRELCYRGLVHDIGELDKQKLRQFVNYVFVSAQEQLKIADNEESSMMDRESMMQKLKEIDETLKEKKE